MIKIVGICKPFEIKQRFFVYDNGNKIDVKDMNIDEIHELIFDFVEKYNCNDIELIGPRSYTNGISNKIKEKSIVKYGQEKIKIVLL